MRREHLQPATPPGAALSRPPLPAAGGDWLRTVLQGFTRLPRLLAHMRPTLELPSLEALDAAQLRALGVRGLIWDVDGTLMRRGDKSVAPGLHAALAALLADSGLSHLILSNCAERRFLELGEIFPAIPLLRGYRAAGGALLFRVRRGGIDRWSATVGDGATGQATALTWATLNGAPPPLSAATALRKPSVELVRFAVAELGLEHPSQAACVGDQRLTDVAGASLAGCHSIKVPTLGRESFPLPVRLLQRGEEAAYRALYGRRRSQATPAAAPSAPAAPSPAAPAAPVEAA